MCELQTTLLVPSHVLNSSEHDCGPGQSQRDSECLGPGLRAASTVRAADGDTVTSRTFDIGTGACVAQGAEAANETRSDSPAECQCLGTEVARTGFAECQRSESSESSSSARRSMSLQLSIATAVAEQLVATWLSPSWLEWDPHDLLLTSVDVDSPLRPPVDCHGSPATGRLQRLAQMVVTLLDDRYRTSSVCLSTTMSAVATAQDGPGAGQQASSCVDWQVTGTTVCDGDVVVHLGIGGVEDETSARHWRAPTSRGRHAVHAWVHTPGKVHHTWEAWEWVAVA
jgi:hypothetical protein